MMGAWLQCRAERQAADAWREYKRHLALQQVEANARAEVARDYMFALAPPPIEKRGGVWFAIIEGGPSVPKVEKRK